MQDWTLKRWVWRVYPDLGLAAIEGRAYTGLGAKMTARTVAGLVHRRGVRSVRNASISSRFAVMLCGVLILAGVGARPAEAARAGAQAAEAAFSAVAVVMKPLSLFGGGGGGGGKGIHRHHKKH